MRYEPTTEWVQVPGGILQNIGTADVELSAESTDRTGIVLKPGQHIFASGEQFYARKIGCGACAVADLSTDGSGGGSGLEIATDEEVNEMLDEIFS